MCRHRNSGRGGGLGSTDWASSAVDGALSDEWISSIISRREYNFFSCCALSSRSDSAIA